MKYLNVHQILGMRCQILVVAKELDPSYIPRVGLEATRDDHRAASPSKEGTPSPGSHDGQQSGQEEGKPSDHPRVGMLKSVDSWMLPVVINGVATLALVDSGASATKISKAVHEKMIPGKYPLRPTRHDTVTRRGKSGAPRGDPSQNPNRWTTLAAGRISEPALLASRLLSRHGLLRGA